MKVTKPRFMWAAALRGIPPALIIGVILFGGGCATKRAGFIPEPYVDLRNPGFQLETPGNYSRGTKDQGSSSNKFDRRLAAARQNDLWAEVLVGEMYEHGQGVEQDRTQAFIWYQKAAKQGSVIGARELARAYEHGIGIDKDYAKALLWGQRAAGKGDTKAEVLIGDIYLRGPEADRDYQQALFWYRKAAEQWNAVAETRLGDMYRHALGVGKDNEQAFALYQMAAQQNNVDAELQLGRMYWEGKTTKRDIHRAFEWMQKSARQGNRNAQVAIAAAYLSRMGSPSGTDKGLTWMIKAAKRGNAQAQASLGDLYMQGQGAISRDYRQSLAWFQKSAAQGNAAGEAGLAVHYAFGLGVAREHDKAIALAKKAAAQHQVMADMILGIIYTYCRKRDFAKAVHWYEIAAKMGDIRAALIVAADYQNGIGVDQDPKQAAYWYRKVASAPVKTYDEFEFRMRQIIAAHKIYPTGALVLGFRGSVTVSFDDRHGTPLNIKVTRSSGHQLLDQAAVQAVKQSPLPMPPDGSKANTRFNISLNFVPMNRPAG